MRLFHIILDSPAQFEITKTELDIGMITQPYIDIAHCIRAGFCVSHALRSWVRITIGFDNLGPFSLTLDPTTIRFLGTDERSILHVILRSQEAQYTSKAKVPYGVSLSENSVMEILAAHQQDRSLIIFPGKDATWESATAHIDSLVMYCALSKEIKPEIETRFKGKVYKSSHRPDLSILELVHTLDTSGLVVQKD
ncbi:MAG: hypothetical protein ACFFD8_07135 [Candidatus Thorarchaeota archaeon]